MTAPEWLIAHANHAHSYFLFPHPIVFSVLPSLSTDDLCCPAVMPDLSGCACTQLKGAIEAPVDSPD